MSLQGTLRTLGITEVLEFLADRSASGRLDIEADGGVATYWMLDGGVASVEYDFDRESGTDAAEATYYALAELDGTFLFDEDQAPGEAAETESVPDVLGRTADAAESWSAVEEVIPTPDHWLTRTESFTEPVTVQPQWWTAIDAIATGCSSRALTQALGMRALECSLMATEMAQVGLLTIGEPAMYSGTGVATAEHAEVMTDDVHDQSGTEDEQTADVVDEPIDAGLHVVPETDPIDDLPEFDAAQYDDVSIPSTLDTETAVQELEAAVEQLTAMSEPAEHQAAFAAEEPPASRGAAEEFAPIEFESTESSLDAESATSASPEWPIESNLNEEAPSIDWNAGPVTVESDAQPASATMDSTFELAPLEDDGWASDHGRAVAPEPSYASDGATEPAAFESGEEEVDETLQSWESHGTPAMPTLPEPESPFATPAPAATDPFGASSGEAAGQHSDLAYLPAPEPSLEPIVNDAANIHAEFEDIAEDDAFGTEDRSSVLKFLRRD